MALKNSPKTACSGFTLVELMVALVLAALVGIMIFSSFSDLLRGFKRQSVKCDRVWEMVMARTKVARVIGSAEIIVLATPDKLVFTENGDTITHTVESRGEALCRDGEPIITGVSKISFVLSDKRTTDGRCLFTWEGYLKNGAWICGETVVSKRDRILNSGAQL
jgi:prepilin-type N-terminal cleavage/methylation domain-containing protein